MSSLGVPTVTLTGVTTSEGVPGGVSRAGENSGSGQKELTGVTSGARGGGMGGYSDIAPAPGPVSDNLCGALYDPEQFEEGSHSFPKLKFHVIPGKFLLMYCVRGQVSCRAKQTREGRDNCYRVILLREGSV